MKLKFNDIEYDIIGGISINKSSREVTFSNITIDFTGSTMSDLPLKLQEIQIIDDNDIVIFYGYIDSYELPEFDKKYVVLKLELTLLSPLAMLSRKTVTINGIYSLEDALDIILAPLIAEGFTIKELNISNKTINFNFISQTIEYILNYLSNTESIWYHISENKEITINLISYQFSKSAVLNITETNYSDIENIKSIKPSITSVDYGNVINAKNIMVYSTSRTDFETTTALNPAFNTPQTLKKGDVLNLNYKIDISEDSCSRCAILNDIKAIWLYGEYSGTGSLGKIEYDISTQTYSISNIKFDNEDDTVIADWILIRDSFYKNLITGIKWNGSSDVIIYDCESDTTLIPSTIKFVNSQEIDINKGKINTSGIIEKVIDLNDRWFTRNELIDYIKSILSINTNQTDEVILKFKGETLTDYKIGDKIIFDLESKFTLGEFIIIDSTFTQNNSITKELELTLRNSNILENFIDFFRISEKQENVDQVNIEYIAEYMAKETMKTTTTLEVVI